MTPDPDDELVFLPLGGSNEIGMNFNLYGYGPPHARQWIVVDLGVTSPQRQFRIPRRDALAEDLEGALFAARLDKRFPLLRAGLLDGAEPGLLAQDDLVDLPNEIEIRARRRRRHAGLETRIHAIEIALAVLLQQRQLAHRLGTLLAELLPGAQRLVAAAGRKIDQLVDTGHAFLMS